MLQDGITGFVVELTLPEVPAGLRQFLALDADRRGAMRRAARESVEPRGPERDAIAWRALSASLADERERLWSCPAGDLGRGSMLRRTQLRVVAIRTKPPSAINAAAEPG